MTTIAILLLLVAAASTSPSPGGGVRRRRDVGAGSRSGSGAMSFSSSSSDSTVGVGARTGFDGAQAYNGVNSGGFAFPDYGGAQNSYPVPLDFNALFQQYVAFMQRLAQQQAAAYNEINSRGGFSQPDYSGGFAFPEVPNYGPGANNYGPGANNYGGFGAGSNSPDAYASASASLSPRGGFGSASIGPPLQTRMGNIPASGGGGGGGGDYSVFSSSSSSSSDIDGVKKSSKEATSVINDNGKVTTYHVSNP